MEKVIFFILKLISKLPFSALYFLSNCSYIFIYYIFRYRRGIVESNIEKAFPEKTKYERQHIEKKFYKNFCDYIFESIKIISMKEKDFNKRMIIENIEVLRELKNKNKDVVLLMGHIFNWEWLTGIVPQLPEEEKYAVYRKIRNKFFSDFIKSSREKFDCISLDINKITRKMISTSNNGEHIYLFIADQSPNRYNIHYDINFMNQVTPVYNGYDKIIRKRSYGVVYINMKKRGRGFYSFDFKEIVPDNEKFEENEIVDKFYKLLKANIDNQPYLWLWTHKRWKYKKGIHYNL